MNRSDTSALSAVETNLRSWGSDHLANLLRHIGLEYVALNPGASYRGLHDSLVNHLGDQKPQMLTVLHEEHAVAIAHGYAKVTGKPMGAILHANVGLMHGSMAIFDAFCDRVPVLVFGATGPVDTAKRRPWIDWLHTSKDQGALVRSFVKWDAEPSSLEGATEAVVRARRIATTVPCGPTYVCFDSALQEASAAELPAMPDLRRYEPPEPPAVSGPSVQRLAQRLAEARRPVILMGRVNRDPEAWQRRVALAERLGATVLTDFKLGAAFPSRHPLHGPAPGYFLTEPALALLREADVVLSLDWLDLAGALKAAFGTHPVAPHVVQVSLDHVLHNGFGGEHQGMPCADTFLAADPDTLVAQLLPHLPAAAPPATRPPAAATPAINDRYEGDMPLATFAQLVSAALDAAQPASLIRTNLGWPGDAKAFEHPLDYLGYDGGGGVGSGPGMCVGAALALRDSGRLAVGVLGDGDFLMGVTALWTAVRYRIPLLVVVANNRSFFNDEVHQEKVAQVRARPVENKWVGQRIEGPDVDIAGMARAQGATAWGGLQTVAEVQSALRDGLQAVRDGKVAVIDVRITREYAKAMASGLTRGD
ncbi:thiamine pyrophosphate-binding protein [Variovorax sp. J31P207]|uniref:thiamine pyrophosphate-binding protein n=1 Tax=Variovorax sp. J31P207 TaxID=3053510 RepID=UPI00257682EC|nr:thiamine pyrophosphate-binding protein [Variovorax sp. J31P207]MDM0066967.1 thiamine pyrophosphate-binding protein [Variovorax sp. J31P207]